MDESQEFVQALHLLWQDELGKGKSESLVGCSLRASQVILEMHPRAEATLCIRPYSSALGALG